MLNTAESGEQIVFERPKEGFQAGEEGVQIYHCKNCGAELMTEDTTTAAECPYCGSPTILPDRLEGGVKPEKVIPFVVTKEQAQKQFEEYFKGKRLLPNIFLNSRNRIAEMRRLYGPTGCLTATRAPISSTTRRRRPRSRRASGRFPARGTIWCAAGDR